MKLEIAKANLTKTFMANVDSIQNAEAKELSIKSLHDLYDAFNSIKFSSDSNEEAKEAEEEFATDYDGPQYSSAYEAKEVHHTLENSDSVLIHKKVEHGMVGAQIEGAAVSKTFSEVFTEIFSILKLNWNNTIQKLTECVAPIKNSLADSAIIFTKKTLAGLKKVVEDSFNSFDIDKEVEKFFNSTPKKDDDGFMAKIFNEIKSFPLIKPIVSLLVNDIKAKKEVVSKLVDDALNTDKEGADLAEQIKELKEKGIEECLNLEKLLNDLGNTVSSFIEGNLTDIIANVSGASASEIVGSDDHGAIWFFSILVLCRITIFP